MSKSDIAENAKSARDLAGSLVAAWHDPYYPSESFENFTKRAMVAICQQLAAIATILEQKGEA